MKLKKNILTILSIALLFLLIGSVSAADTNDTQIISASDNDILSVENDVDVLGEGEYSYTQLKDQFRFDGDITLTAGNYTYVSGDGDTIEITTSRVIDGNGAVIDMANSGNRAFFVMRDGVTIKNLTIKNANYNGNGGAIYFSQSGTVENCNFTNNTATNGNGGAIWMNSGSVTNCNFTNNKAEFGGAVYFWDNGDVTNCNFVGNKETGDYSGGGAIRMSSGSVTNCNFTDNQATGDGGAIYFAYSETPSTVTNCNFTNNKATGSNSWGGAVYMYSGSVTNCNFTNNTANYGGAVYFNFQGTVTNCNFTGNNATGDGGAVYFVTNGNVENCNFTDNQATGDGGAIQIGSGSVTNCNFTDNQATGDGGAIDMGSGSVTNCNFTGNNATTGSAIYFYTTSATKTVSNSSFSNNRANAEALVVTKNEDNITITFTGNDNLLNAIYSEGDVTFTNVTYWSAKGIANTGSSAIKPSRSNKEAGQNITVEIYDSNGQSVDNVTLVTDDNGQVTYDFIKLNNGNYTYKAYHSEDCYYTYAEYNDTFTLDSDLGDFNRLQKYINGAKENSILTLCRNYTFTPDLDDNLTDGIVIDKQLTINGNGHTIDALQKARIFDVNSGNVVLNNITFTNATSGSGGAIWMRSGSVTNCNFTANQASRGGAVYFSSNSEVINCNFTANQASLGGAVFFWDEGTVTNCNFTANQASVEGGAVFFWDEGTVTNCNFTANQASVEGGAVYFDEQGTVTNCNFTANQASVEGGAIRFNGEGTVTNCNFTANQASVEGGAIWISYGSVTNCNFTGNKATGDGGAILFVGKGSVTNCNFTGNNATTGSAIYFRSTSSTKTVSNSCFLNNRANAEALEVTINDKNITIAFKGNDNLLNAIYSRKDAEVTFTNVTYWSANGITTTGSSAIKPSRSNKEAGQNISVVVVVNYDVVLDDVKVTDENGTIVLPIIAGENYYISARHDTDSYYTEKERTNSNMTVNVTSQTTNNRTVNITAKSNIYNEVMPGKLLFILPNSTEINASYASNGTWWALHTFDDAGDYNINATYIGLDNVAINNATIRIMNVIPINTSDISIYFGDVANVIIYVPESINGQNITITINKTSKNATVNDGEAKANFTDLPVGEYLITVDYLGDDYNCANSTNATLTVSKRPTKISIENKTLDLFVEASVDTGATLIPAGAGNLTYTSSNPGVAIVENGKIKGIRQGEANITVSFAGNENYTAAENKTIAVTVSLNDASVTVNNETLNLEVGQNFTIVATTTPEGVNVTYVQDDSGVYIVDENGVVTALKNGTGSILVKIGGYSVYAENSTIVNVTVSKVHTEITVLNDTIVLAVSDEIDTGATLTPPDAGNLTYKSSDENIVKVEDGKIIALKEGNATITVSFKGDNKYAAAENKSINVTVSLNDASVSVNNKTLDLLIDDTFTIVATTTPEGLNVSFVPDDSGVYSVDENGNVIGLREGEGSILIKVGGDGIYAENYTIVNVTVSKIPTEITVDHDSLDLFVGDEIVIVANLTPAEAGNVSFTSSDENIVTVDDKGNVIANGKGQAIITVSFAGDNKYAAAENKTIKASVEKLNATMDVSADEITEGENATISVTLPSDATGNVNTTVNGKTYSSEVKDGKAVITIPDLIKGDYTLPVNYSGDDKYNPSAKDVNFTVKEDEIIVSAPDLTKYFSGYEPFIVNVTYARGVPAADKEVKITINGVTYIKTTDENGIASLSINLNSKTYDVTTVVDNITVNSIVTILPTIEAEDIESKSKNIVFTATFLDSEGKYLTNGTKVSFNIGGVIYNSQISGNKGLASIDLILDRGRYTITSQNTVTYENAVNSIAVDLKDAEMIISGDEITVGENATISTTLPSDATGNVTATINGKTYMGQVKNGKATITIPDLSAGNYTASVTYSGDYKYNSAKGDANITVNKINASMTVDAHPITAGENATVTVTLPSDATGNITIGTETVLVKDGAASAVLTDLPVGTNTVPVTYSGDDKYNPTKTNVDVVVNEKPTPAKENLTIKASAEEITEGENATVIVTGLENATGNVSTNINGKTYTSSIEDGKASITVPGLIENVTAVVNYPGDDKYNPAITTVNITVNRNTVTINAQNLTKNYKDPQKFTVKVTDAKGQAAPNKTVEITINGVTYKRTTDENGTASLNINLGAGEYPVSITVDDVTVNSTVTVKSTIDASDVVKMFRNNTQYYATFTDANGTPLANTQVSFNINGIIYNRTTDANGTAKMNINMGAGEYIITATNPVTGEMKSNSIKVISLIESDDLTKYYKNASQFVVRIHSADGGYVGAGEEVTFNINGVFYTRTTNATGHAKLNINLAQGNYTITTYYKDCSQGNEITVLPVLSADDLVMKYRDGSQFKAKLVDGQGKAYPGQSVQFNINGVLYNRVTGSDGIAKLNINLMSGQYIITSSYNGANIANKITIRG